MAEQLEKVGAVSHCMASPQSYESHLTRYSWAPKPSAKRIAEYALQQLEDARKKDVEAHERNLQKIEANKVERGKIIAVMNAAGIPDSYSETDPKSRARFPKKVRHDAGYIGDMRRNLPINDGFDHATGTYNRLKEQYGKYAAEAELADKRAAEVAEREKAAAAEKRRADLKLASIILRYKLPEDSDWENVLEELRKKDQRLDLAVAMWQTRGDWSEGYWRVSDALGRFTVETPEDAAIQTDILSCFNDDIDGRVFRDTTWNYGRLFAEAADEQLAKDIQEAMGHADAY